MQRVLDNNSLVQIKIKYSFIHLSHVIHKLQH